MFLQAAPIDIDHLRSQNFWDKVYRLGPNDCWVWLKSIAGHGYGNAWDGRTVRLAHRCAWALHHDQQVPDGMTIDHVCRNRRCCNPRHLRLLSNVENATDNGNSRKTHCPQGHPYDEINTRRDGAGGRRCLTCRNARNAARRPLC